MIKKILFLLFSLGFTALPAWAVDTTGLDNMNPTFSDIYSLSDEILNKIPYFLGGLAFLAILYSGAIYITSFGDPARMESAKKNLTWTVTGILAVMSVYGIMSVIMWIANTARLS
jgi:hypothetical protein